jgi:hypothetical protein
MAMFPNESPRQYLKLKIKLWGTRWFISCIPTPLREIRREIKTFH